VTGKRPILVIATLDTKGVEAAFLCERIRRRGALPVIVDAGILGTPVAVTPDVTREELADVIGKTLADLRDLGERGPAVEVMCEALAEIVPGLHARHGFVGGCGIGGLEGSVLAGAALRALPFGIPKIILSPVASGVRTFGTFVGESDIALMHSVADLQGLNSVTARVLETAAGMACSHEAFAWPSPRCGRVGMSLNGNTTPVGEMIRHALELDGWEVVAFHSNGVGGVAMERLAAAGGLDAIVDLTTNELADELTGGLFPVVGRLKLNGEQAIPRVVVPGCLDFICQGPLGQIDPRFEGRPIDRHNPEVTLVRVSTEEAAQIARTLVDRLVGSAGCACLVIPTGGLSMPGSEGGSFRDPDADHLFTEALVAAAGGRVAYTLVDAPINSRKLADATVAEFRHLLEQPVAQLTAATEP
jgi:uncharacterized protein (UPF0261 family)